jgi:endonuclease/exonuclease/phosphatase family metal-dependent hydrolase
MFIKRAAVLLFAIVIICYSCSSYKEIVSSKLNGFELKVMTWNIWGRLNLDPRYTINGETARARVIEILQESEADIITMTETYGSASAIAAALDYSYYTPSPDANLTIFSRYPIVASGNIRDLSPFSFITATIELPNKKKVQVYNIWLTSEGRHIVDIKNDTISDATFDRGDEVRYDHLLELLNHEQFISDLENKEDVPLIVAGDFNCVSHLDYTPTTKSQHLNYGRVLENKT